VKNNSNISPKKLFESVQSKNEQSILSGETGSGILPK